MFSLTKFIILFDWTYTQNNERPEWPQETRRMNSKMLLYNLSVESNSPPARRQSLHELFLLNLVYKTPLSVSPSQNDAHSPSSCNHILHRLLASASPSNTQLIVLISKNPSLIVGASKPLVYPAMAVYGSGSRFGYERVWLETCAHRESGKSPEVCSLTSVPVAEGGMLYAR
jgi:hypothetical protein